MEALRRFWQFLNTDIKDIPWGDVAEQGIEAITLLPDGAEVWEDNADKIPRLAPLLAKAEPLIQALDNPVAQLTIAGLPFVSVGINLLKIGLELAKVEPTFESSVAIVAQLAYLKSLEGMLTQNRQIAETLGSLTFKDIVERQLARLATTELTMPQAKQVTTQFRESILAEQFGNALTEQLHQAGLEENQTRRIVDQVAWGSRRYFHLAIAEAGESVEPLAEFYRTGGEQEQERYNSIDEYLKKRIKPLPLEQVFDEANPKVCFQDIYVRLEVQPLTQAGEVKEYAEPLCSHRWTQQILEQPADEPRKVMFVEGDAGRGKSVFCRMIANWTYSEFGDAFIPLRIRLRDLRTLANNLTETLEDCPELEQVSFVRGESNWLADKNTRFLIILDGFDELLLEGRATGGLKEFLQQVVDFQRRSHHQLLVTGRPLALQGIDRQITQYKDLERVRLEPLSDELRERWLVKWQTLFGEAVVTRFRDFLTACPNDLTDTIAREPLLLYLLARLNREEYLTAEMFAGNADSPDQETQAKLRIYRQSVNWVLEKQREDENLRLSGLNNLEDLREVLQEAALCVVQSGNETARLDMLKQRFKASSNPISEYLKQAQEATGQTEDKALNNLLTAFYLKPGEGDKQGAVEFAHKSFGEYLFAERLIAAFETWTEVDRRKRFRLAEGSLNEQIYDVFGYGGLSQEIVAYLRELLKESEIDRLLLFSRLHNFYQSWCQREFLDAVPNENLPQKKFFQLRDQQIPTGLQNVDVFAGLNVMIVLFKLHADAQPEGYPNVARDTPSPSIWFHPCGEPDTEEFESGRFLKSIQYADSLGIGNFTDTVGPHLSSANLANANLSSANLANANLSSANLSNANLYRANLSRANLSRANLSRADLYVANLYIANLFSADLFSATLDNVNLDSANLSSANLFSTTLYRSTSHRVNLSNAHFFNAIIVETDLKQVMGLTLNQLTGKNSPLICNSSLPSDLDIDSNRDWDRLAALMHERYPEQFELLEDAEMWVEERRPS